MLRNILPILLVFVGGLWAQAETEVENYQPFWWEETVNGEVVEQRAAGPIFERGSRPNEEYATIRPLVLQYDRDEFQPETEFHFLLPLYRYVENPQGKFFTIFELITFRERNEGHAGGEETQFTIFPFVFYNDNSNFPDNNYFGIFPLYGTLDSFFFITDLYWAAFPLYFEWERFGTNYRGTPWPFIQTVNEEDGGGLLILPFGGELYHEGVFRERWILWPLIYERIDQMDKETPRVRRGFLPFYALEESENVIDETYLWPFFGYREETEPYYYETRYLWPLLVQGEGEGRIDDRWMPFYWYREQGRVTSTWYGWPAWKRTETLTDELKITRDALFYFLYWNEVQESRSNPDLPKASKTHIWPLISTYDNGAGLSQAQVLSPFEVLMPHNQAVRDLYTPMFALYRRENNENSGDKTESYFWGLIEERSNEEEDYEELTIGPLLNHKIKDGGAAFSIGEGLIGYSRDADGEVGFSLLWMDF